MLEAAYAIVRALGETPRLSVALVPSNLGVPFPNPLNHLKSLYFEYCAPDL